MPLCRLLVNNVMSFCLPPEGIPSMFIEMTASKISQRLNRITRRKVFYREMRTRKQPFLRAKDAGVGEGGEERNRGFEKKTGEEILSTSFCGLRVTASTATGRSVPFSSCYHQ